MMLMPNNWVLNACKEGCTIVPDNYRGISLLNTTVGKGSLQAFVLYNSVVGSSGIGKGKIQSAWGQAGFKKRKGVAQTACCVCAAGEWYNFG